jgi:carbon-monoxide dehydrogenase large subunit
MEIRFDPSGAATVVAGTFSHGQGHETVYPQIVSEWLGIPMDGIRLIQGDTDRVSFGRAASRFPATCFYCTSGSSRNRWT